MINTVSRKSANATAAMCTHLMKLECYFLPVQHYARVDVVTSRLRDPFEILGTSHCHFSQITTLKLVFNSYNRRVD